MKYPAPYIGNLNKQKCLFFRNREQEGKTGPIWRLGSSGMEEGIRKGCRRVNVDVVEILCSHVCKWKNETC
jgi:hypothetical protein